MTRTQYRRAAALLWNWAQALRNANQDAGEWRGDPVSLSAEHEYDEMLTLAKALREEARKS